LRFQRLKISDITMPTLHRYNILAGLLLAALGAFILQQSLQWEILGRNGPGVGFFPLVYGSLIVVLSLVLLIKSLRAGRRVGSQTPEQPAGKVFAAVSVWVAFAVTVALMKFIGFYVALGLLVMFMTRFIFSRSTRFALLSSVLVPLTFFVVFGLLLKVQLPVGIWTGV
jgi:putative tricarboxylic transport membrane protein